MQINDIIAFIFLILAIATVAFAYYVDIRWTKEDKKRNESEIQHFNTLIKD